MGKKRKKKRQYAAQLIPLVCIECAQINYAEINSRVPLFSFLRCAYCGSLLKFRGAIAERSKVQTQSQRRTKRKIKRLIKEEGKQLGKRLAKKKWKPII